jgi:hypothetical protein
MHSVGPRIWQETLKNEENKKYTQWDLDYGEKNLKCGKRDTNTV